MYPVALWSPSDEGLWSWRSTTKIRCRYGRRRRSMLNAGPATTNPNSDVRPRSRPRRLVITTSVNCRSYLDLPCSPKILPKLIIRLDFVGARQNQELINGVIRLLWPSQEATMCLLSHFSHFFQKKNLLSVCLQHICTLITVLTHYRKIEGCRVHKVCRVSPGRKHGRPCLCRVCPRNEHDRERRHDTEKGKHTAKKESRQRERKIHGKG
jgi:hypothetical protein